MFRNHFRRQRTPSLVFATSDSIRAELTANGIVVEQTKDGGPSLSPPATTVFSLPSHNAVRGEFGADGIRGSEVAGVPRGYHSCYFLIDLLVRKRSRTKNLKQFRADISLSPFGFRPMEYLLHLGCIVVF